jgi:pyruvate formate lyase activating enzyme
MNNVKYKKPHGSIEIGGMLVSSVEFPGKMSLVIFTAGCMLRCPYCHNPGIINGGMKMEINEIFKEIDDSLDFIDSVVLTGGEPLIQYEGIFEIVKYCKNIKLDIKIDTNGYYPEKLEKLVMHVDYVALDIKAPFNKYKEIIGEDIGENVRRSMEICSKSRETYFECRTTYVPGLMGPEDIIEIAKNISCDSYTLQQFRNKTVLDEKLKETPSPSRKELIKIAESVKPFLNNIKIKTSEFGEEIINRDNN